CATPGGYYGSSFDYW
nr:immunoglobulin heavy chain junction region [Mus musculus]